MKAVITSLTTVIFLSATPAWSAPQEVWHGWSEMPGIPCSKIDHYKDSFGIQWPTVKTAPQEHHTRISLDIPNWSAVENMVKNCAVAAVGGSGAAAFFLTPASAWPAFKATFMACTAARGTSISENLLSINMETRCRW